MRFSILFTLLSGMVSFSMAATATDTLTFDQEMDDALMMAMYQEYLDSIANTIDYQTGTIQLGDELAILQVPIGYKYVDAETAEMILTELWGNPPASDLPLGMLFPEDSGPNDLEGYVINISYADEGHVDDDDAKDIDYDDLLETLIEDTQAESNAREAEGYGTVSLVGWGNPPYYDAASKKLHWAMELNFDNAEFNTLNYSIRVLGREGYLILNAIGDMQLLPEIKSNIDGILSGVEFQEGQRYTDYRPGVDRVAAYGVGGLIAGKVLAKTGILAAIGVFLLKAWKLIVLAVVGLFAGFKRFLGKE